MSEPKPIRRIGVVVEMANGQLFTLHADCPGAEILIETETESETIRGGGGEAIRVTTSSTTDITVTGIRQFDVNTNPEQASQAIAYTKLITKGDE